MFSKFYGYLRERGRGTSFCEANTAHNAFEQHLSGVAIPYSCPYIYVMSLICIV